MRFNLMILVLLVASNGYAIDKAKWVSNMYPALTKISCLNNKSFLDANGLTQEVCKAKIAEPAFKFCIDKYYPQIPDDIANLSDSDFRYWSDTIGDCFNNKLELLTAEVVDSARLESSPFSQFPTPNLSPEKEKSFGTSLWDVLSEHWIKIALTWLLIYLLVFIIRKIKTFLIQQKK